MSGVFPELPAEIIARVEGIRNGHGASGLPRYRPFKPDPTDDLTPRETDVLALIAEGLTDDEIGARLGILRETVKTHVKHVLRKLDVANRAHAVANGFRHGDLV